MGTNQRVFSREIGDYNGVANTTEAEAYHLAKDSNKGRKKLDPTLQSASGLDELNLYRDKCIKAFEKHTAKHMDKLALEKINAGIADYVKSSVSPSAAVNVLKASILNALGEDFLTRKYQSADEGTKQIIKLSYFEDISSYQDIPKATLISPKQILKYIQLAQTYTSRYLYFFFQRYVPEIPLDENIIYRGSGNKKYYKVKWTAKPDKLSIFSGFDTPFPYYESHLLTSYSLSSNVAEQFMLDGKNIRRTKTEIHFELLLPNIFSSFMVSADFDQKNNDAQFEFLVLPNRNPLSITSRVLEDLYTEFTLTGNSNYS